MAKEMNFLNIGNDKFEVADALARGQINNFIEDHSTDAAESLVWDGSMSHSGDFDVLKELLTDYDYIKLQFDGGRIFYADPTQAIWNFALSDANTSSGLTVETWELSLTDHDASASVPEGSTRIDLVITQLVWDGDSAENAVITPDADSSIGHLLKIIGVKNVTNAELEDIRVGADGTVYPTAGDAVREQITDLTEDLDDLNEQLDMETFNPVNVFDGTYTAVLPPSSASGSDTANANNSTTDFIEAKYVDKVFCGYTGNVAQALTSYNPVYITEYNANKQWLYRSSQFPAQDDANGKKIYTVTQAETKYIRVSFANSMVTTSGRLFEIAINIDTSTYIYYTNYFEPYTISKRFYDIEHLIGADFESKVIDCWGDSRTEMIAGESTSFCDYLQELLGDTYNVCNYGISSQSSGMCAARLGSNEVFVTLTGNQIPASGEVALTGIKCSSGNNRNLYAYSPTSYIPCMLNGVRGRLSRASIATYNNVKFLRDSDGGVVRVVPRTKIVVPDMGSKHHFCVLWWGKNDFDSSANYVVSGILDNYAKAVEYLGHKKYVILGETCSIKTSYEPNGADRVKLDTINATLAETYPDNYIDINAWLSSEDALTSVGLTATETDLEYIEKGFPCYQLMVYSTDPTDTTHPNAYGRQAIAHKIHEWMTAKGWI